MTSITLYHRQQFAVVTIATDAGATSEIVPLAVAQFIAWLLSSLAAQFAIVAASIAVYGCGIVYERVTDAPQVYVDLIISLVSTGRGWL